MTYQPTAMQSHLGTQPTQPSWIISARAETAEDLAFISGAALCHLHLVLGGEDVPQALLRQRLALRAAEVCVRDQGRPERAADLRDAVAFLDPGASPGPAGEVALSWRRAVERPVSVKALHRALPGVDPEQIAAWLDGHSPNDGTYMRTMNFAGPVLRAACVLRAVLESRPRDHTAAVVLADAALSHALGWSLPVPLLALGLTRSDVKKTDDELRLACHRAIATAAAAASQEAIDLTRRVVRLRTVAPKLRAKGAEDALTMFLTRDAVAPTTLTVLRSGRAARRFCDRLVALGVVRELTGRETFRLYGV
ncbi:hypothetical protein GCM10007385_41350 [Tateyamaria omphalii]|uniref:DUF1403 family protein n=1 Tax=Tateyamaria omphalii TaxID=299262 RepID=UPI00167A7698|nr:DUF1403 family protein [Tateyamaria omphalii]GGX67869.1 hypothetical protein GCM10007385_41350 [Tateyamaria omphalii]